MELTGAHNDETVSILLGNRLLLALIALASDYQSGACGVTSLCLGACSYTNMTGVAADGIHDWERERSGAALPYLCKILNIGLCNLVIYCRNAA